MGDVFLIASFPSSSSTFTWGRVNATMPSLPFVTLDVFTTERFKGNPLGLIKVPQGQDVSSETMQTIAREFNLSESVFLYEGKIGADGVPEWRYRIFMTEC